MHCTYEGDSKSVQNILVCNVLVFGSASSSPTISGRFASWLGRSTSSICNSVGIQIFVDDPLVTFDEANPNYRIDLGIILLWAAIAGFPIKLEKPEAGQSAVHRCVCTRMTKKAVVLTIPKAQG